MIDYLQYFSTDEHGVMRETTLNDEFIDVKRRRYDLHWCLGISFDLNGTWSRQAFQSAASSTVFKVIESVIIARCDVENHSELWYYCKNNYDPKSDIERCVPNTVDVYTYIMHDPRWSAYDNEIMPVSDCALMQIQTHNIISQHLVEIRKDHKDHADSVEVFHKFSGISPVYAKEFDAIIEAQGLNKIFDCINDQDENYSQCIYRHRMSCYDARSINIMIYNWFELCKKANARYVGWSFKCP
jgi:hypothetical protein